MYLFINYTHVLFIHVCPIAPGMTIAHSSHADHGIATWNESSQVRKTPKLVRRAPSKWYSIRRWMASFRTELQEFWKDIGD